MASREKFATQVNAKTLAAVRRLAEKAGRSLTSWRPMDAALPNTARSTRSWRDEGFPHHRRRLGHPCRPQTGYYADIIEEAAALWESLPQGHPFIDGNKRTALAASH